MGISKIRTVTRALSPGLPLQLGLLHSMADSGWSESFHGNPGLQMGMPQWIDRSYMAFSDLTFKVS
jgi:hypothetical protein